jgi:RluA family pseudouridine synthase
MDIQPLVLWSDETLLVVNKPPGLRTIPDGYDPSLPHLSGMLGTAFGRVWVVHRLDKDTSGVILFARSAEAHRVLNTQFEQRKIQKEYHVIVAGIPDWEEMQISLPLRVDGDRKHRTVIDHQAGKPAETTARVLRQAALFAVIAALPHTGYTHQIRAHLAAVGFPVLADPLYRSLKPETLTFRHALQAAPQIIQRIALHAFQIQFAHPVSAQPLTFQAPYAEDFQHALDVLEANL